MASEAIHFVAKGPTPVFNTRETPFCLPLPRKEDGRIMAMETIAFPGTLFKAINRDGLVWQVETNEYPSAQSIYVDSRFLLPVANPKERRKQMPDANSILEKLKSLVGTRYFWGGNFPDGISDLLPLYSRKIPHTDLDDAVCRGVDCSGLLYYVTNGCTPRNTSQLIEYGTGIFSHNLNSEKLLSLVQPLDLVVWRGHVLIVLSKDRLIESRIGKGVIISNFIPRMEEAMRQLDEQKKPFYIRRWHTRL